MLIVADIAGQFDALMRLVKRATPREEIILLGDLVDRGQRSREVIEWAMQTPNVTTLLGNHEHMMLDYYRKTGIYPYGTWLDNGGGMTKYSYDNEPPPESHLEWLEGLPWSLFHGKLFLSHAPLNRRFLDPLEADAHVTDLRSELFDLSLIWNRGEPVRRPYFQVFGHNSNWGLRHFADPFHEDWAVCLDQSRSRVLTGMLWPSREILEEPYLEVGG